MAHTLGPLSILHVKKVYTYKPIYFSNYQDILYQYKNKKGCLNLELFSTFTWKWYILVYSLKIVNTRELPNAAYALLLPG